MKTKRSAYFLVPVVILWVAAVLAASMHDLDISLAIANDSSVWGRVLEVIGEPPAILFASFNFAVMCAYFMKRRRRTPRQTTLALLCTVGIAGTAYFAVNGIFGYLGDYGLFMGNIPLTVTLSVAVSIVFSLIAMKMKRDTLDKIFGIACRCVLAAAITLVTIWALKFLWGRVRFRQLDGDLSRFTPWYRPNGVSTKYHSFPSGHTANATVILTVTYYFRLLKGKMQRLKPLFALLLVLWIAVVAFSRVAVGAHYLSDVLFGMAVTLLIVYFTRPRS